MVADDPGRSAPHGSADLGADRVGYRQVAMWLSDDEVDELATELREVVERREQLRSNADRRRRILTAVIMPDRARAAEPG